MDATLHTTKTTGRKRLDNQGYVFTKSCSAHTQRTEDQRHLEQSAPAPAAPRPIPGDRSAQETLIARNTKEPGGTMAGGGPEIRDSEKWSSHPSPSQGHPAQPRAPGAGCDCHPESGAAPWLTSHCSGAFWGCTLEESRGGETKGRKREGSKCLVEYLGWEAGLSVLAWPCPMPINAVWPVLAFSSVLLGEWAQTRLI